MLHNFMHTCTEKIKTMNKSKQVSSSLHFNAGIYCTKKPFKKFSNVQTKVS